MPVIKGRSKELEAKKAHRDDFENVSICSRNNTTISNGAERKCQEAGAV